MEDYAAKMTAKPDADLRRYLAEPGVYREAAVLAALAELRRRGQPHPDEAALRPALEAAVAAEAEAATAAAAVSALANAAPGRAARAAEPNADPDAGTGPALYSPGTIAVFTAVFPIVGGSVLMGLNLGRLRRWGGLALLVVFTGAYLLGYALVLMRLLGGSPALALVLPVLLALPAIAVLVGWFWPRYCGPDLVAAGGYRSRGWVLPLVVGMVLQFGIARLNQYLVAQQPPAVQAQMQHLLGR